MALRAYEITLDIPREEVYGLTRQIRRAASSIPTDIAEGCGRSDGDFGRFLQMAMGSASELEYLLLLARDLSMLTPDAHGSVSDAVVNVKKMLASLIAKLSADC